MSGRIAAPKLRLQSIGYLPERGVARDLPIGVIDDAEPVDVDDRAGDRRAGALTARDLLAQPCLEVVARLPACDRVADAGAKQTRAVDQPLESRADDRADVTTQHRVVAGDGTRCAATRKPERTDQRAANVQRVQRDLREIAAAFEQETVVRCAVTSNPRLTQRGKRWREPDETLDKSDSAQRLRETAEQQMAQ